MGCSYIFIPCLAYQSLTEVLQSITEEGGCSEGLKLASGLLKNMFDFGVSWSSYGQRDFLYS